jgi:hypothetical protein
LIRVTQAATEELAWERGRAPLTYALLLVDHMGVMGVKQCYLLPDKARIHAINLPRSRTASLIHSLYLKDQEVDQ